MDLKEVKSLLELENTTFKKQYGQNFLIDDNILDKITDSEYISDDDVIIEIGPGLGSLTDYLIKKSKYVIAYEIDQTMINILEKRFMDVSNITIIKNDILKANIKEDLQNLKLENNKIKVIANLPYYITTPILLKLLEELDDIYMIVMMQKEVAQRICGKVKTKEYNALSVLIQYAHSAKILFDVSPKCFYPEPEVISSVVKIEAKEKELKAVDEEYFYKFNRNIFKNRRKTLYNNLRQSYNFDSETIKKIIEMNNYPLTVRSEELEVNSIVKLANDFYLWSTNHE